jgi:hypothetical protein
MFRSLCRDNLPMQRLIFKEFIKGHPEFISGCTHMQKHIINETFGASEWNRILQHRLEKFHSTYKTPQDILRIVKEDIKRRELAAAEAEAEAAASASGSAGGSKSPVPTLPELSNDGGSEGIATAGGDSTSNYGMGMLSALLPQRVEIEGASDARLSGMNFDNLAAKPPPSVKRRQQRHSLDAAPTKREQPYAAIPSPMDRPGSSHGAGRRKAQ